MKGSKMNLDQIKETINQTLRSTESKEAYGWIKKLTILNPNKRDGGIFQSFFDENKNIIEGD